MNIFQKLMEFYNKCHDEETGEFCPTTPSHSASQDPKRRRTSKERIPKTKQIHPTLKSEETVRRFHVLRNQGMDPAKMIDDMINEAYDKYIAQLEAEMEIYRKQFGE